MEIASVLTSLTLPGQVQSSTALVCVCANRVSCTQTFLPATPKTSVQDLRTTRNLSGVLCESSCGRESVLDLY